ncbi:MAG: dATP/dGTP diphosphohydrolase domain-containing protein [Nanoarchaeota archaeon]
MSSRKFNTGAVRDSDEGKENYIGAISFTALKRYVHFQTEAAKKYPDGNWRKGIPLEEFEKSLMRHLQKYFSNKYDGTSIEPDVDHLSAAWFNLQGIIHEEEKLNEKNKG